LCLERLAAAHDAGRLQFFGNHAALADTKAFDAHLAPLRRAEWVVYTKKPFGGPEQVLRYMARYTHRVAIANSRLVAIDHEGVSFKWRDYRADGPQRIKVMTLAPESSSAASSSTCCLRASTASATMAYSPALSASKTLREPASCSTCQLRNRSPRPPKTTLLPTPRPCVRVRVAADACSSSKFSRAVAPLDTALSPRSATSGSTPHDLFPPATSSKNPPPVSSVLDRPR
jgi:Putative transposase